MVVSPFCYLENIQKWQGPAPSRCVLPLQQSFSFSGERQVLCFHSLVSFKAFSRGPQTYKQTRICYREHVPVLSIMGHFHNRLQSSLPHNYKYSISCSIWETQIIAMDFSIFIPVHYSTTNPPSLAGGALGIYLSRKRILSTFYFVAHVSRSAVLCLPWKSGKLWQRHLERVPLVEKKTERLYFLWSQTGDT